MFTKMILPFLCIYYSIFQLKVQCSIVYRLQDSTREGSASGEDVVDATISKVKAALPDWQDFFLLKRLALVESNFGKNVEVITSNENGGIWQITSTIYNKIVSGVGVHNSTSELVNILERNFNIQCLLCEFNFKTPLHSALAACIYIDISAISSPIPITIAEQANWWRSFYQVEQNASIYVDKVLEFEAKYDEKLSIPLNLWFLLDGTVSVSNSTFQAFIDLVIAISLRFVISPSKAQVGLSIYSNQSEVLIDFENTTTNELFPAIAQSCIEKKDKKIYGKAMEDIFSEGYENCNVSRDNSNDVEQKIVFVTNRKTSDDMTRIQEIMDDSNVTIFLVDISDETFADEAMPFSQGNSGSISFNDTNQLSGIDDVVKQYCTLSNELIFTEDEINYICVLLCGTLVDRALEYNASLIEVVRDLERIFNFYCSSCQNYSSDERQSITSQFQQELLNPGRGPLVNAIIRQTSGLFLQRYSGGNNDSEESSSSASSDIVCGKSKANIWILLDGSLGVLDEEFQKMLQFSLNLTSRLEDIYDDAIFGLSVNAHIHTIYQRFSCENTLEDFEQAISRVQKFPFSIGTMEESLEKIAESFTIAGKLRSENEIPASVLVIAADAKPPEKFDVVQPINISHVAKFVIGFGNKQNLQPAFELASTPNSIFTFPVNSINDYGREIAQQIANVMISEPLTIKRNERVNIKMTGGIKRQLLVSVNASENLLINISNFNPNVDNITMYVGVGKRDVNSANNDGFFSIEEAHEEILIEPQKLVELYPDFNEEIFDVTIAIQSEEDVELELLITSWNSTEELIVAALRNITEHCGISFPRYDCIWQLEKKLSEAEDETVEYEVIREFIDILTSYQNEMIIFETLQNLTDRCNVSIAINVCVESLQENLNNAQQYDTPAQNLLPFYDLLSLMQQDMVLGQLNNITNTCKEKSDKTSCIIQLEVAISDAERMNISANIIDEFNGFLRDFQTSGEPREDTGQTDFQKDSSNLSTTIVALLMTCLVLFLVFIAYKQKQKSKVNPDIKLNELLEELALYTQDAHKENATFTLLGNLKGTLAEIECYEKVPADDLTESYAAIHKLEMLFDQFKEDLKEKESKAKQLEASANDLEALQNQISLGKKLLMSSEDLKEPEETAKSLDDRIKMIEEIDRVTQEALVSSTSAVIVENLEDLLQQASNRGLSHELFQQSYDVVDRMKAEINEVLKELNEAMENANSPLLNYSIAECLADVIEKAKTLHISPDLLNDAHVVLDAAAKNLKLIESIKNFIQENENMPTSAVVAKQLKELLDNANEMGITRDQLNEAHQIFEKWNIELNEAMQDLNRCVEEAKESPLSIECLSRLEEEIARAKTFHFTDDDIEEATSTLERLKKQLEVTNALRELVDEAHGPEASTDCLEKLKERILEGRELEIPDEDLKNAVNAAEDLEIRLQAVQDLEEAISKAKRSPASIELLENLKEKIQAVESLDVPLQCLQEAYSVLEDLKEQISKQGEKQNAIDKCLFELDQISKEASGSQGSINTLETLKHKLEVAQQLEIASDRLQPYLQAHDDLQDKIEKLKLELDEKTKQGESSNSTFADLCALDEVIRMAELCQLPEEYLKHPSDVRSQLHSRINEVRSKLKELTNEAKVNEGSNEVLSHLKEQVVLAQNLKLPSEDLEESLSLVDGLNKHVENVIAKLKATVVDAMGPDATTQHLNQLHEQLVLAQELNIPPDVMRECNDAIEALALRIDQMQKNLADITEKALDPNSKMTVLTDLQETIVLSEVIQLSPEALVMAYNAVEQLSARAEAMVKNLENLTAEVDSSSASLSGLDSLQEAIALAEEFQLPSEQLQQSYQVVDSFKSRLDAVTKALEATTLEACQPGATVATLESLKEQIVMLQEFKVPKENLEHSYNCVEKLSSHIDSVYKELDALTINATEPAANMDCLEMLNEKLLLAEKMGLSREKLSDSYSAVETLQTRADSVTRNLLEAVTCAKETGEMSMSLEELEMKMAMVEKLHIPSDQLEECCNALSFIKERTNKVKEELKVFSEISYQSSADFNTLQLFLGKYAEAEKLKIPPEELQETMDALEGLKFNIDTVVKEIQDTTEEGNLPTSSAITMEMLQNLLLSATNMNIPDHQLASARDVLNSLERKDLEVNTIKTNLKEAIVDPILEILTGVLDQARATPYLLTWQPNDVELVDLLEEAVEIEEDLKAAPQVSPEEIERINTLREELEAALKNNVERKQLKTATTNFKRAVGRKSSTEDKELISIAKEKFLNQTKQHLLAGLNKGITSRDTKVLKAALNEVTQALQGDIRKGDIDADPVLKSTIEKAQDLLDVLSELEKMKAAIMSLKQPTISEIRSYSQPPTAIRQVMEATLILLGEDKKKIKEWIEIQALIGRMGKDALKRRIWDRDVSRISKALANNARPLLSNLKMDEVEEISKAASTFFAWSKCVLMEVDSRSPS